jgi:hypothetical protein
MKATRPGKTKRAKTTRAAKSAKAAKTSRPASKGRKVLSPKQSRRVKGGTPGLAGIAPLPSPKRVPPMLPGMGRGLEPTPSPHPAPDPFKIK